MESLSTFIIAEKNCGCLRILCDVTAKVFSPVVLYRFLGLRGLYGYQLRKEMEEANRRGDKMKTFLLSASC